MKPRITLFIAAVLLLTSFAMPVARATDISYWGLVNQVTSENPMSLLKKFTSPEFFGRQTGFEGEKVTTDFIADYFKNIGLTPAGDNGTFFQQVPMKIVCPVAPIDFRQLDSNNDSIRQFVFKKDYNILIATGSGNVAGDSVFCGYGLSAKGKLDYDDYAGIDVKGKIAIMFRGGPSFFTAAAQSDPSLQNKLNFQTKVANAQAHGATAVLLIENPFYPKERRNSVNMRTISAIDSPLPALYLTVDTGDIVLSETGKTSIEIATNIESQKKPYSFPLSKSRYQVQVSIVIKENYKSPNVVGYIPSSDPFGANETLLIGAHWDHIGVDPTGTLYPGANDNGSGLVSMMEVARVFATNKARLRMNLAFAAFTGEEIGLLGSAYMAENCPFPTDGLSVMNMDMVGGRPNTIICSTDPYFESFNTKIAQSGTKVGANMQIVGPSQGGSDHYSFYVKGITSVFILASDDMPGYHTPEDTYDKVHPDGILNVCKMATMTACTMTDPFYLSLDNPGPVTTGSPEYEITGYSGKGAHINVGGRNTIASETGRFTLSIPVVKGSQTVKVVAIKPGSAYKLEKELTVTFELRSKAVSSISQINFGHVSSDSAKEVKFDILNKGEGPLSGTIKACGDWMEITPDKFNANETTITAKVKVDKLTDPGFHICMLEVETNNGRLYIPVTAITGDPLVIVDMEASNKKATIAGSEIPIDNPMITVDNNVLVPLSVISMAFGATSTLQEDHATIALGSRKTTVWPDTNIALIGNEPMKLASNIYGIGSDFMLPLALVEKLGIKATFDEETGKCRLTFDSTPFNITWKPKDLAFEFNPQTPNMEQVKLVIGANRPTQAKISSDSDWMVIYPPFADIGAFASEFKINFVTSRFIKKQEYKGNINVSTDLGTYSVPITVNSNTAERVVQVQIGSNVAKIDGKATALTSPPFIDGGTTMVPYRFLGEAFGAEVEWVAESKTVRTTMGRTTIELVINSKTAKINGIPSTLAKAPKIVGGKTFVPFRFIGEAFKANVDWDQTSKTVTVTMDMLAGNPKVSVKPKELETIWADASADKNPPIQTVDVKNDGQGTLQILETNVFGSNLKAEVQKDKVTVTPIFNPKGAEETATLLVKTNAGADSVKVNLGIYPTDTSILRSNSDGSWHINGNKQPESYKRLQDLVSVPAARVAGAAGGTSLYDDTFGMLTVTASGHILSLNTITGDFSVDGIKVAWKFKFFPSETDISLPLAVYSLAFNWKISEMPDGTVRMTIPKDKPPFLVADKKSVDLIWDQTPRRMTSFASPTYPLKKAGTYDFDKAPGKYRLFLFIASNSESENVIPYVESLQRRYSDSGLSCALVSSSITNDYAIEAFFAGNNRILDGLSSLSIAGLTLPIIFDPDGIVCNEFAGEAVPRLYIVDEAGNLLFDLPELDSSQIPYLEQAVASIVAGSASLPTDIQPISVKNTGGAAGEGSITPANPEITVLKPKFKSCPATVAVSFQTSVLSAEENLPAFKKANLTLLGNSNQTTIQARMWKLPKFSVFTSFSEGSDMMRFGKVWRKVPQACKAGENPVCAISEIVNEIGGQIQPSFDGKFTIVAGEKEILVTPGQSKVFVGATAFDLGEPITIDKGILFGPAKLVTDLIGGKMYRFDDTICLIAPSLKAMATGPILSLDTSPMMFNNYIQPVGGYPPAPDFELTNYPMSANKKTSLSDILARKETKVLVIDFWATWCPPCKSGMPYMEKMYRDYKDKGLAFYGIISDANPVDDDYVASVLEDDARIRGGLKKLGLDAITYPMMYDNLKGTRAFELYKGSSIPRVVVITKDKKWAFTKVGFWEIGHRNLEFTVRRLLGIEETSKIPSIQIKNAGVGELNGKVTVSLPYIKPVTDSFKTLGQTKIDFVYSGATPPNTPEAGTVTITSNAGNLTIPIQYNPMTDYMPIEFNISTETGETTYNGRKTNINTPSIYREGKYFVAVDVVMSMLGGTTKIFPDRKRAKSVFENWDINYINGSQDISLGPLVAKTDKAIIIENGHVFVDTDSITFILDVEFDMKDSNTTIVLRRGNE